MTETAIPNSTVRYRITGMDCSGCAAKIESAVRRVPGVDEANVSIASQIMTLRLEEEERPLPLIEETVTALGYQLARADGRDGGSDTPERTHVTPVRRDDQSDRLEKTASRVQAKELAANGAPTSSRILISVRAVVFRF
ncbi:hypothetical protein CWO91_28855 [Bradyrhizobium genosp. SA-3]|uniref:heavy-metal-associated domain-containing protein n=1 Tax=Bradyrhizobium genosp. SA-3 TaxID=508868 RepID=UPI00102A4B2A|nr:cation transporter [Bradyrhizobium genosp. SA-3]RZN07037.1 hypothetical protein CWO91_28855 [Bradyrhizobium genosp. SA-3]